MGSSWYRVPKGAQCRQILRTWKELIVLVPLAIWGLVSAFDGAGLSMFVSGPHSYQGSGFIELVYFGVLAGVLVGLFHARIVAILLLIDTLVSGAILLRSDYFGLGVQDSSTFLWAIAIRPLLASLLLFALPVAGPLWRLFLEGKRTPA